MSEMMDKKEILKRLKQVSDEIGRIINDLDEPEAIYLTPDIAKQVERKKKDNLCFYCEESLSDCHKKDIVRNVHRKCYRKIIDSDRSIEFHVMAGLLGEVGTSGRKKQKDKASELAEQLGDSIAPKLIAKATKKKSKP